MRRRVPGWNPVAGEGFCTGHDPDRTDMVYLAAESEDQTRRLCLACFADAAVADAVVIPRSAIPDGLVERLELLDLLLSEDPNWDGSALRRHLRTAARLLSGATTEGDEG